MPSNLLAHHLHTLEDAGLVTRRRSEGDRRRTYLSLIRRAARPLPEASAGRLLPQPRRVLFVCTANTARSHLAAAIWRRASPLDATCAGTHPGDRVNPGALAAARRHRLDVPDVAPRLLADTLEQGDLVITVCRPGPRGAPRCRLGALVHPRPRARGLEGRLRGRSGRPRTPRHLPRAAPGAGRPGGRSRRQPVSGGSRSPRADSVPVSQAVIRQSDTRPAAATSANPGRPATARPAYRARRLSSDQNPDGPTSA